MKHFLICFYKVILLPCLFYTIILTLLLRGRKLNKKVKEKGCTVDIYI